MGNEDQTERESFVAFLERSDSQEHFAALNMDLLQGKHIQRDRYNSYQLLTKYEDSLKLYYQKLYGLSLLHDKHNNETYYYLDFTEDGKGKIGDIQRHRELSPGEIVISLMLLKMYYERYFESSKEIRWEDLRKEILESENSNAFKIIFFNDIREDYSDPEWGLIKRKLKNTLRDLQTLGWIKRFSPEDGEEIHFVIKESIHRFAKLYEKELTNFDAFVETYQKRNANS